MSVATPTILQRPLKFPDLLPKPPQPHPLPLSRRRVYGHLNAVRDLQREMDDLSDEENELEDIVRFRRRFRGAYMLISPSLVPEHAHPQQRIQFFDSDRARAHPARGEERCESALQASSAAAELPHFTLRPLGALRYFFCH